MSSKAWWLRLIALALIIVSLAYVLYGPRERSTAEPHPTETKMDYPY